MKSAALFDDGYGLKLAKFVDAKGRTLGGAGQRGGDVSFPCAD
mgnify:CR=1 FL=1